MAPRRRQRRPLTATALALAALLGACGGGDDADRDRARDFEPALTERDRAGDVLDDHVADQLFGDLESFDEASARTMFTDERPELDLRGAGLTATGRVLRLHVATEAPIGTGTFAVSAFADEDCVDPQLSLTVRVEDRRATTVAATDLPHGQGRPVDARVEVAGERLAVALPLRASARLPVWQVSSSDAAPGDAESARYGDDVPEWAIEGAYFTRGTGRRNDAGGPTRTCGPPDPPLLAR